jgi:microsomal dipeptidase-like Zn-dependent dipeptidase
VSHCLCGDTECPSCGFAQGTLGSADFEKVQEIFAKLWEHGYNEADILKAWREVAHAIEEKYDAMERDREEM